MSFKADGVWSMVTVGGDGAVCLQLKGSERVRIGTLRALLSPPQAFTVECECIEQGESTLLLAFDCSTGGADVPARLAWLHTTLADTVPDLAPGIVLRCKPVFPATSVSLLLSRLVGAQYYEPAARGVPADGLVFTPKTGALGPPLKWKDPRNHTVDFGVEWRSDSHTPLLRVAGDEGCSVPLAVCRPLPVAAAGGGGTSAGIAAELAATATATRGGTDGRFPVWEFRFSISDGNWVPVRPRNDKDKPNHLVTLVDTLGVIAQRLEAVEVARALCGSASAARCIPCVPAVAIIVPFRVNPAQQREAHLARFLVAMTGFMAAACAKRGVRWTVFVMEQPPSNVDARLFNRGALLNVGAAMAMQAGFNVLVSHDVDLVPQPGVGLEAQYTTAPVDAPIHLGCAWGEYTYPGYVGGVLSVHSGHFAAANGYPNTCWGWGGEDDRLRWRLTAAGVPDPVRPVGPPVLSTDPVRYVDLEVELPGTRQREVDAAKLPKAAKARVKAADEAGGWKTDGLTTLKYRTEPAEHGRFGIAVPRHVEWHVVTLLTE